MKTLKIYDPAMCCSTGVCGPEIDSNLVQLAAFLKRLDADKVKVERYNLAQQPDAYASNPAVAAELKEKGTDVLPLIFIDDKLVCSGGYPETAALRDLLNIEADTNLNVQSCCSGGCCE